MLNCRVDRMNFMILGLGGKTETIAFKNSPRPSIIKCIKSTRELSILSSYNVSSSKCKTNKRRNQNEIS